MIFQMHIKGTFRFHGLIVAFLLFCCVTAVSQTSGKDSLSKAVDKMPGDSAKVDYLNKLFLEFEFTDDRKAKVYLDSAFSLSKKLDYKKGVASCITYYGYFYEDKGDYLKALNNYNAALNIYTIIKDQQGIANSYNYIGIIYFDLGNYPEALKNYFLALKIKESLNDKNGSADIYNNIGLIYSSQDNYTEALTYYNRSLNIY
jgi:tetratricopeptide (TPR) repeat protein